MAKLDPPPRPPMGRLVAFPGTELPTSAKAPEIPPPPPPAPRASPASPSPSAQLARYRRRQLRDRRPANWAAFNVASAKDNLVRVLPWLLLKSYPRPLSRTELHKAWGELAISAEARGLAPCLLYQSRQGRRLVRLPRWLNKTTDPTADQTLLQASKAMELRAAENLLRTIAIDMRLLSRLYARSIFGTGPRVPLANG